MENCSAWSNPEFLPCATTVCNRIFCACISMIQSRRCVEGKVKSITVNSGLFNSSPSWLYPRQAIANAESEGGCGCTADNFSKSCSTSVVTTGFRRSEVGFEGTPKRLKIHKMGKRKLVNRFIFRGLGENCIGV